ncbi:MAG: hypothetical protein EA406_07040 [Rhodospirillales bacterium]|nr:MAG: hypothetical protein EA406_07040 [Rhodospirillales bacterium]
MTAMHDVSGLVTAVTDAARHLVDLIVLEDAALDVRERDALPELAEAKGRAARSYEAKLAALARATDGFRRLDPLHREALAGSGQTLAEAADGNMRRLAVAVAVNRRFMDAVAEAVREVAPLAVGYGSRGAVANGDHGLRRMPAVTVDRSL